MAASLDMVPDNILKAVLDPETQAKIDKIDSTLELIDSLPVGEMVQENPPKQVEMQDGFMFQAGKSQVGEEPFWIEVHLVSEDTYYVSANLNGVLSRAEVKALRKNLKKVMNMEKNTYDLGEKEPAPAIDFAFDNYDMDNDLFDAEDDYADLTDLAEDEVLVGAAIPSA